MTCDAFVAKLHNCGTTSTSTSTSLRMAFGDTFYRGFEKWCSTYAEGTRADFPDVFKLPEGVVEVELERPLGIVFEEMVPYKPNGVKVAELVPGGNAEASGLIGVGDLLIAATGVKQIGKDRVYSV